MRPFYAFASLLITSSVALADPAISVQPQTARAGDAVLITVTGVRRVPRGSADGKPLTFFPARRGYQAVFAVPLDTDDDTITVEVDGAKQPAAIGVRAVQFPETDVIVEEEFANPPAEERAQIDEDNRSVISAMTRDKHPPRFARAFRRPAGKITSRFGEWRTFNDGHRSQHLGLDFAARVGTPVLAANTGIVTLVRDTYLAGKVVILSHGGGMATGYFHLSAVAVREGDMVRGGELIARAGRTGRTTGPHIHLAVHVPGGFVNPASFTKLPIAPVQQAFARRPRH